MKSNKSPDKKLESHKVDVAISVYGKPYQTAVTLLSLLKYSDSKIDKIYFILEKKQPYPINFEFLLDKLSDRVIVYKPKFWWFYKNQLDWKILFKLRDFRYSIRYQYAWEKSDKKFLIMLHNDMYFKGDIVSEYLDNIGEHIGIGNIGQCWNCPASSAGLCNGESFTSYRPTNQEVAVLFDSFPPPSDRKLINNKFLKPRNSTWPLPECRLNEYVTMVNLEVASKLTWPYGNIAPFGLFSYETGVEWFKGVVQRGYYPKHFDYERIAVHGWASDVNSGHGALFDTNKYKREEDMAKELLQTEFGMYV